MRIHTEVDISEPMRELKRLDRGPGASDLLRLDSILLGQFQEIQVVVHVQTGSLRNSGDFDTSYRNKRWRGEISFGGASPGAVHNPVKYAGYERDRGQSHDFLRPVYDSSFSYIRAIKAFLRGSDDIE